MNDFLMKTSPSIYLGLNFNPHKEQRREGSVL